MRRGALLLALALLTGMPSLAWAKLPPPTPEEQAKAEEAKAKAAEAAKKDAEALAKAMDRVAERYFKEHPQAKRPTAQPEGKEKK